MKDFKSLKGPARKVTWRHEYIYIPKKTTNHFEFKKNLPTNQNKKNPNKKKLSVFSSNYTTLLCSQSEGKSFRNVSSPPTSNPFASVHKRNYPLSKDLVME